MSKGQLRSKPSATPIRARGKATALIAKPRVAMQSEWELLNKEVLEQGISGRQVAIVLLFSEASRRRLRRRLRISIPVSGLTDPKSGPVRHILPKG